MNKCICCNNPGVYSILLAVAPKGDLDDERYYLPNQTAREHETIIRERWFCKRHMVVLEDNLRATIQYLQSENDVPPVIHRDLE